MKGDMYSDELLDGAVINQQHYLNAKKEFIFEMLNLESSRVHCKEK